MRRSQIAPSTTDTINKELYRLASSRSADDAKTFAERIYSLEPGSLKNDKNNNLFEILPTLRNKPGLARQFISCINIPSLKAKDHQKAISTVINSDMLDTLTGMLEAGFDPGMIGKTLEDGFEAVVKRMKALNKTWKTESALQFETYLEMAKACLNTRNVIGFVGVDGVSTASRIEELQKQRVKEAAEGNTSQTRDNANNYTDLRSHCIIWFFDKKQRLGTHARTMQIMHPQHHRPRDRITLESGEEMFQDHSSSSSSSSARRDLESENEADTVQDFQSDTSDSEQTIREGEYEINYNTPRANAAQPSSVQGRQSNSNSSSSSQTTVSSDLTKTSLQNRKSISSDPSWTDLESKNNEDDTVQNFQSDYSDSSHTVLESEAEEDMSQNYNTPRAANYLPTNAPQPSSVFRRLCNILSGCFRR